MYKQVLIYIMHVHSIEEQPFLAIAISIREIILEFYFISNLFLFNFVFQFLKFRTFPCKRVDLLLIFKRNIRVFSSDLQSATKIYDFLLSSVKESTGIKRQKSKIITNIFLLYLSLSVRHLGLRAE